MLFVPIFSKFQEKYTKTGLLTWDFCLWMGNTQLRHTQLKMQQFVKLNCFLPYSTPEKWTSCRHFHLTEIGKVYEKFVWCFYEKGVWDFKQRLAGRFVLVWKDSRWTDLVLFKVKNLRVVLLTIRSDRRWDTEAAAHQGTADYCHKYAGFV